MADPIALLALDLDGTLAVEDHKILPRTRAALTDLHAGGVHVVIATGRRYRTTTWVIENLGFDVFAICNGGALIKHPDRSTLHAEEFAAADIEAIVALARSHGYVMLTQRDPSHPEGTDFLVDSALDWNPHIRRYVDMNRDWAESADLLLPPPGCLLIATFDDEPRVRAFATLLGDTFPNTYNTVIVPDYQKRGWYCEITKKAVTKWTGLLTVAGHLGLGADQICAVGDQMNDLSMVSAASHGVAMGNAVPELKAAARFVCGNHDADGLLEVVDYIHNHNIQQQKA